MIYGAKIYDSNGVLTKEISAEKNKRAFWANLDGGVTEGKEATAKRVTIKCKRCGDLYKARSTGARYCRKPDRPLVEQCHYLDVKEAARQKQRVLTCKLCGVQFRPRTSTQKWCGEPCNRQLHDKAERAKIKPEVAICKDTTCGKSFERKSPRKLYCSKSCADRVWARGNYTPAQKKEVSSGN